MTKKQTPAGGVETPYAAVGGLEPLIDIEELAQYLGVPVVTIYRWRVEGNGPCAVKIGRHLKFTLSDVQTWLASIRESAPGARSRAR